MRIWFFLFPILLFAAPQYEQMRTIYHTLDPLSLSQNFAYYKLYPESDLGKRALRRSLELINKHRTEPIVAPEHFEFPDLDITSMISFVNRKPYEKKVSLDGKSLDFIDRLGDHLPHRHLKGHQAKTIEELYDLRPEEVDLSRALLLYQFEGQINQVREYEATLDLMALQILARLPKGASDQKKIEALTEFIFHEKGFRFPPHSLHAKDIDLYTFLPSVMDSQLGVCLGVSILYLTLAQRIDLPLEIVTPAGHIYLRYQGKDGTTNIETTARGIHIPTKEYMGINTIELQTRNMKEMIGLNFMNQAAVMWQRKKNEEAIKLYETALRYLPNDRLVHLFLAYNLLIVGEKESGERMLRRAMDLKFGEVIYPDSMPEDYFSGQMDSRGIEMVFDSVDETRDSILNKQKKLKEYLKEYPKFRDGIFQLAITWLQLSRTREALAVLKEYRALEKDNPTAEYYLSLLYLHRNNLPLAWKHYNNCYLLLKDHETHSHILRGLKSNLRLLSPQKGESR